MPQQMNTPTRPRTMLNAPVHEAGRFDASAIWWSSDIDGQLSTAAALAALATLDVRDNPLSWPAPANLTDPPARLTALLPDTASWVPPRPGNVTADAADASVTVTWDHPGAGDHYLVDTYTINYRPADQTGDHTQLAAAESPAAITGLTNATEYAIFVTATNTQGTSNPSLTVAATPSATAQARTGAYSDSDDIDASAHEDAINALAGWHIFDRTDCSRNPLKFCPDRALPRWKLAVWLVRALDRRTAAPTGTDDTFNDVTKWYKPFVERLRVLGVTTGCVRRSTIFCPNDTVTRAEMAVFLVRAFNIPSAGDAGFTDIDHNYWAYNQINALADANITQGCNTNPDDPLIFCPEANTTNAQMAAFIHRACTNTNPVIGRDCSPTDIDNGGTGGGGGTTPQAPQAPTIEDATRGAGTITVTWRLHSDDADRTITRWQIRLNRITYTTSNLGITTQTATPVPLPDVNVTDGTADQHTHTIKGLDFDTEYRIEVSGYLGTTAGTYSTPETATTNPEAVRLVALEVTQGLQNWNHNITLVKGKRTVVRAFLEPESGTDTTVDVKLYAILPEGTETEARVPLNAVGGYRAEEDDADNRGNLDASANFVLSRHVLGYEDWIGDPDDDVLVTTPFGTQVLAPAYGVTYRLEVDEGVICDAAGVSTSSSRSCSTTEDVDFVGATVPSVVVVPLEVDGVEPDKAMIVEQIRRIKSLMPVAQIDVMYRPELDPELSSTNSRTMNRSAILDKLTEARVENTDAVMLGIARDESGWAYDLPTGSAWAGERAAWWRILMNKEPADAKGYTRNTGSHEFGHILGSGHAVYWDEGAGSFRAACTAIDDDRAVTEYPHLLPEPTDNMPATKDTKALLGPSHPHDAAVWGLDTRVFDATGGIDDSLAVMDPSVTYSIMSYCGDRSDARQVRWVDAHFHQGFVSALRWFYWGRVAADETISDERAPRAAGASGSARDVLVVAGSRTVTADGEARVVSRPTYTYSKRSPVGSQPSGDWVLELLDSAGAVLRSVPFAADTTIDDLVPSDGQSSGGSDEVWRVLVENPPAYSSYRVRRGPLVVAESTVSPSAPAVTVTSPVASQVVDGSTVTLAWSGSDADGDALTYHVHYSSDGGNTYSAVGVGLSSTSLVVAREDLAGSTRARLRVIASDGTRSTTAESALFTVAQNAPEVFVHSPSDGQVFGGPATVVLDATALDTEDGVLADSAVVWSSDIDGVIANGAYAWIGTGDLSVGTHVLTATATDSSARAASVSVTVEVRAGNDAPSARGDIAYAPAAGTAAVDVLSNDSDTEDGINPWSLRIVAPAALGEAAPDHRRVPAAVIYEAAAAAGYDTMIYEICDRLRQCSTAELVVTVLSDY